MAVPYLYPDEARIADALQWPDFVAEAGPLEFDRLDVDHPLHVVFSSGTTGLPKPIVHGHAGVLVDQLKDMAFHLDVGPGDRMFIFSTTSWVAWNWLVSALSAGAGIVLFDGNPLYPNLATPWQLAGGTRTTFYASRPRADLRGRR